VLVVADRITCVDCGGSCGRLTLDPELGWEVGDVNLVRLAAPVTITYADGDTADLQAYLGQNRETGGFEVCSVEE
jgi:hypothetical protein